MAWERYRITDEKLRNRGMRVDQGELEECAKRKSHFEVDRSDEGAWAERIIAEGLDDEGVARRGYAWLGEGCRVFLPHKVDDVLRGTDAIILLPDRENERRAYSLAVDATTHSSAVLKKINRKMECLDPDHTDLPRLYWVDAYAEEPELYYDSPQEGKISSVPVTLYVPEDAVEEIRDPKTTLTRVDQCMHDLRPFVLHQLQVQLELQARYLLGEVRWTEGRELPGRTVLSRTREELKEKLRLLSSDRTPRGQAFLIISHALEAVWTAQKESGPLSEAWEKRLPLCIKDMKTLPIERTLKAAA